MHTYIHTYITYIHTLHTCIHAYMHTCIHAYMHTCIHAYIHIYIYAYIYICAYIYIHMHIHTYIYISGMIGGPYSVARSQNKFGKRPGPTVQTAWRDGNSPWAMSLRCFGKGWISTASAEINLKNRVVLFRFWVLSVNFFWQVDHREQVDSCSADMASVFIGLKAVEKTSGSRSWSHAAMCPMFVWQLSQKTIHVTIHVTIWTFKISSDDLNHPCFKNTRVKSPVPRARQVHHVTLCRCWGSWGSWGWAPSQESWLLSPLVKFDVSAMILGLQVTITTCRGLVASPVWIA